MEFRVGDKVKIISKKNGDQYTTYGVEKTFTKSDLKDGDKCTLKNGQVIFVDKTSNYGFNSIDAQLKYFNDDVSIVKVERPVKYETLFEREEEILDETEKRYLSNVIKPFRDKVKAIEKVSYSREFIKIYIKEDEPTILPFFWKRYNVQRNERK